MPEGAEERKMVGAAMHSCSIAAMMKMGGEKNYSNREPEPVDINRFSHCTTVPSSARAHSLSEYGLQ